MSKCGKLLYVVERNSQNDKQSLKEGMCGDFLRIHELANNGIALSMESLPGFDVRKRQLVGGDK